MSRWRTKQVKKTFIQFLTYYLFIALLPLLCVAWLYCNDMISSSSDVMMDSLQGAASAAMRSVESHLSIIDGYPRSLSQSNAVQAYHYDSTPMNRISLISEIKRTVGGNDMLANLMIYFRSSQTFVSAYSNSWSRQSLIDGHILVYDTVTPQALAEMLDTMTRAETLPAAKVRLLSINAPREMITFFHTLPMDNRFAYACTIALVDSEKLRKLLDSGDADAYLIVDEKGQVLLGSGDKAAGLAELLPTLPDEMDGAQRIRMDQEEMILSWSRSPSWNYTLVRLTSFQPFMNQRQEILRHLTGVLLVLSVLIAALITFFMRRTFIPIQNLANMALRSGFGEEAGTTAYSLIHGAMRSLEIKNIQLSTHLERQNPVLAEYAVRTLLSTPEGHWNQHAYEDALSAGLCLNCGPYQVLVFQFEQAEEQLGACKNLVELCGEHYIVSFSETLKERIVLLIGHADSDIAQLISARLHFTALGIGTLVEDVRQWNASYIRAAAACDNAAAAHKEQMIVRFDEIPAEAFVPCYPWEELQMLAAAINQSNTDMVRTAGQMLMTFISQKSISDVEIARSVFLQALQFFYSALPEKNRQIQDCAQTYHLKSGVQIGWEMADILSKLVDIFCENEEEQHAYRQNSPIYRSLSIISEEIGSEHLSLAYVAERVGLSPSRYSALFLQEMNQNFKVYVDSLRLSLAKHLLRTSDLQINAVASRVGYHNAYSFARFFKSQTGCTPTEYRETLGKP